MSHILGSRSIAAMLTVAFVAAVPNERIHYFIMASFGLCHYAMALHYSRRRIVSVVSSARSMSAFAAFLVVGTILFLTSHSFFEGAAFKLLLYFGIHHMFNEAHFSRVELAAVGVDAPLARVSCTLLHGCAYMLLISKDNQMAPFVPDQLAALTIAALIFHSAVLVLRSQGVAPAQLLRASAFELGITALALAVYATPLVVRFTDVVFFHFAYWALQPIPKIGAGGRSALTRYALLTFGLTGIALLLSPIGLGRSDAADGTYYHGLFLAGSYFHITTSFALSSAQPELITRWFSPKPAGAATALAKDYPSLKEA